MHTVTLNNGLEFPRLGLGVYQSKSGQETIDAIHWALEAGYRHIDTAKIYRNEESVGKALRTASVAREDIWLTTKIWNDDIRAGRTTAAIDESLQRLGLDYVDLMLLHWPTEGKVAAWQELERAVEAGKLRSIGVSNFLPEHLEEIYAAGNLLPVTNQIEYHPTLVQAEMITASLARDIVITAWSPLMQGKFLQEPLFAEIASKYDKTAAQVVLRWCLQNGVVVIPKSVNRDRIIQNGDIFDFELSEEDVKAIDRLDKDQRLGPDPANFDF